MLDFGCGTGRTVTAFLDKAASTEFFGCDIHPQSIAWANSELSPPFTFFVCEETPPLDQPDERFDLIYAISVFTHITDQWSNWLVELHRVMRPGGIAVISVIGQAGAKQLVGIDWDDRIGMAAVDFHKGWEIGGPSVLLAECWIRKHWGRAFEILRFAPTVSEFGHDLVVMRRREVSVTAEQLTAIDPHDPRELQSLAWNLEMLQRQGRALGEELRKERESRSAAQLEAQTLADAIERLREGDAEVQRLVDEAQRREAEIERLQAVLSVITSSSSWRLTAPLRRARTIVTNRH